MKIIGISGSLRRASFNTGLLRAAVALVPAGVELEIAAIDEIPLYNGDLEASEGIPRRVVGTQGRGSWLPMDCCCRRRSTTTRCPVCSRTRSTGCRARAADSQRVFGGRAVGDHGGLARQLWLRAGADGMAADRAHAAHAAVVRRPAGGRARGSGVRRDGSAQGRQGCARSCETSCRGSFNS